MSPDVLTYRLDVGDDEAKMLRKSLDVVHAAGMSFEFGGPEVTEMPEGILTVRRRVRGRIL